jgi:hypothetical protein
MGPWMPLCECDQSHPCRRYAHPRNITACELLAHGTVLHHAHHVGMTLFPDDPPPSPPANPKLTAEERKAWMADRLAMIRLRMAIWRTLDDRGITDPAAIGATLCMSAAEATKLLTWRRHG